MRHAKGRYVADSFIGMSVTLSNHGISYHQ